MIEPPSWIVPPNSGGLTGTPNERFATGPESGQDRAMRREDGLAIIGFLLGVGLTLAAMAAPMIFDIPLWVLRSAFAAGTALIVLCGAFLLFEFFIRSKPASIQKYIWIGAIVCAAFLLLGGLIWVTVTAPVPENYAEKTWNWASTQARASAAPKDNLAIAPVTTPTKPVVGGAQTSEAPRARFPTMTQALAPVAASPPLPTVTLYAECLPGIGIFPDGMPSSGIYYMYSLKSPPNRKVAGDVQQIFGRPGAGTPSTPRLGESHYTCSLYNYGNTTLSNVAFNMHFKFQNVVQINANQQQGGDQIFERDAPITIAKLDPGKEQPYSVVINNVSGYFVFGWLPTVVSYNILGQNDRVTTSITKPETGMAGDMQFSPPVGVSG